MVRASLSAWFVGVIAIFAWISACGGDSDSQVGGGGVPGSGGSGESGQQSGGTAGTDLGGKAGAAGVSGLGGQGQSGQSGQGQSGQGGEGGSGGSPACQASCQVIADAGCSQGPALDQCVAVCVAGISVQGCQDQGEAQAQCISSTGTASCDAQGQVDVRGCDPEIVGYLQCTACLPLPTDTGCNECLKQQCCDETQTMLGAPGFLDYARCVDACGGETACMGGCGVQYPAAQQGAVGAVQCSQTACGSVCSTG